MYFTKKITVVLEKEVQNLTPDPVTDLSSKWHALRWLRQLEAFSKVSRVQISHDLFSVFLASRF